MIVEALAAVGGVAAVVGLAVYAVRSVRTYADRALAELEARRVADVGTANMAGDLRIADSNTAAFKRAAERERIRATALEEVARRVSALPDVLSDRDAHGVDLMLAALRDAAGLAPAEPLRTGGGRGPGDGADRLPGDRGPGAGADAAAGPATVPGA